MNNVRRIAFDPFVPLVILDVQRPGDMSLDEERADAVDVSALAWFLILASTYGSKTTATVPAMRAAMIGMMILGWLTIQSRM